MTTGMLVLIIALAGAAVLVVLTLWLSARRMQAMRACAAPHGRSYMGKMWVLGDCDFSLFRKGYRRSWSNVLSGTWNGVTLVYADYEFTERSGRSSQTYVFSSVVTDLGCVLPEVEVTARSMIGELAEQLGVHGLEFESEEFNRRFVVHADDQRFGFELMDARMMEVLLGGPPRPPVPLRAERDDRRGSPPVTHRASADPRRSRGTGPARAGCGAARL